MGRVLYGPWQDRQQHTMIGVYPASVDQNEEEIPFKNEVAVFSTRDGGTDPMMIKRSRRACPLNQDCQY